MPEEVAVSPDERAELERLRAEVADRRSQVAAAPDVVAPTLRRLKASRALAMAAAIYRKLGVSSSRDAVQHATAVGLLGG